MFVFFATVFLKIWYWLFRFWKACIQNFVRCKNMYSKYMYMTALLSQIIRTCGNTNLENIFCWENLQCCCYSNNILHFQSLLPHIFCFKRTFFFSFFILVDMLINFVIFMITIFVDQLFCQPLFSCHYLECWIWEKAWAFLYNLSCTSFFQKLQAICFLFLIFFLSGIGL